MKFIISALFVVAACLSGTFAQQPCVIVDPTFESTWPIGSTQLISWTNAVFTTLDVYLDDGSSSDYHINLPAIINNLPVSPNYYYFIVPSILAGAPITVPGTYAIQFGIAPNVAYGGPVIITAPDGVVQTTPAPPPPGSSVPIVSVSRVNSSALANVSSPGMYLSGFTDFDDALRIFFESALFLHSCSAPYQCLNPIIPGHPCYLNNYVHIKLIFHCRPDNHFHVEERWFQPFSPLLGVFDCGSFFWSV
jgi:hypothetical protein